MSNAVSFASILTLRFTYVMVSGGEGKYGWETYHI